MKYKFVYNSEPKPMQSVKFARIGEFVHAYQPAKNKQWKNWIKIQTQMQLPENFKIIDIAITITKLHFIFMYPKNMPKYKINDIVDGIKIYKPTRPDLTDNLCKGFIDALNAILWVDDSQIVRVENLEKYYGLESKILLDVEYDE